MAAKGQRLTVYIRGNDCPLCKVKASLIPHVADAIGKT